MGENDFVATQLVRLFAKIESMDTKMGDLKREISEIKGILNPLCSTVENLKTTSETQQAALDTTSTALETVTASKVVVEELRHKHVEMQKSLMTTKVTTLNEKTKFVATKLNQAFGE